MKSTDYLVNNQEHNLTTLITNGHVVNDKFEEFKREHAVMFIIAFCGGADMDPKQIMDLLRDVFRKLSQFPIAILTGGTKGGIPEAATEIAREFGMKVIAVNPACAKPHNLINIKDLDLRITVDPLGAESVWGSETALLVSLADAQVIIGGGAGTLIELAQALKINSSRTRLPKAERQQSAGRQPIVIAPVSRTGGVADLLPVLLATSFISPENWAKTLPPNPLQTGVDVADFLIRSLNLYESIDY